MEDDRWAASPAALATAPLPRDTKEQGLSSLGPEGLPAPTGSGDGVDGDGEAACRSRLLASPRCPDNGEVAFLLNVNKDLRARLDHKDREIQALAQRLAALQREAAKAGLTVAAPSADDPLAVVAQGPEPPSTTEMTGPFPSEQAPPTPAEPTCNPVVDRAASGPAEAQQPPPPPPPQQQQQQQQAEPSIQLPPTPMLSPPRPVPSMESIGDFHAINSSSLPLLSAAHMSRHNTMSLTNATASTPGGGAAAGTGGGGAPASVGGGSLRLPEPLHQTDTASIRRRYMALEKGPHAAADLLFSNPDIFFQSNVVLEFDEDSPSFRRKLQAMDENVEGMRNHLSRLVGIVQKYIEAGLAFSGVGRTFASELMHLQGESWFTRLGDLAPALIRFGETIDEIQNYRDAVLMSLEATFLAPMREFMKIELREVKDLKEEVHRAHEDYLAYLQRYLQLKRGADPNLVRCKTQELIVVRRRFELARYDLVNTLNQLETKKKFQLVERVLCALYAYLGFFHQGHMELATLEPSMRDLQHQLRLSRREFAKQSRIAEAKRMQLELLLSSALTNIQAVKQQLSLDDWGALFDELHACLPPLEPQSQPRTGQPGDGGEAAPPSPPPTTTTMTTTAGDEEPAGDQKLGRQPAQQDALTPTPDADAPASPVVSSTCNDVSTHSYQSSFSFSNLSPPGTPPPLAHHRSTSSSSSSMMMSPCDVSKTGHLRTSTSTSISTSRPLHSPSNRAAGSGDALGREAASPSTAPTAKGVAFSAQASAHEEAPSPSRFRQRASVDASAKTPSFVKQGYLWKRSSNVRKDWKRRFFFIRGGKLSYQRENDPIGPPRADICDLLISTVRECVKDTDARLTFEIISPGKRPYMLQAENEEDYLDWIRALRSQTASLLTAGVSPPVSPRAKGGGGSGNSQAGRLNANAEFLERVRGANPVCADCGSQGPEWACINWGTAICIECSGIHRSLGVHVSKVRSLTLDKWTRSLRSVMEAVGNDRFNKIWEAQVPPGRAKPAAGAPREEREEWIRDKYLGRAFISQGVDELPRVADAQGDGDGHGDLDLDEDPDEVLYAAARKGDACHLLWALAHGGDVNWANDRRRGRTPVHAACEAGSLACLELLCQNGASLDVVDADELSPLDVAMNVSPAATTASGGGGSPAQPQAQAPPSPPPPQQQHAGSQTNLRLNQLSVGAGSCGNIGLVSLILSKLDKKNPK